MKTGWLFLVLNIFSYGLWGLAAKVSQQKGASPYMTAALTTLGTVTVTSLLFVPQLDFSQLRSDRSYIIPGLVAGASVALGNLFIYKALETIPVSIAYPASALYIIVSVTLAVVFLKEQITINHGLGVVCAVLAVFFMSR